MRSNMQVPSNAKVLALNCLLLPAGQVTFEPSFQDTQAAALSVLEGAVVAAMGLPKITPSSISSSSLAAPPASTNAASMASNPTVIPSTGLTEELVQQTAQVNAPECDCIALCAW
jgi:hypothetical protein